VVGLVFVLGWAGGTSVTEVAALEEFYWATDGQSWLQNTNWLTGDPCGPDGWFGLTCGAAGGEDFVRTFVMYNNNLSGDLPDSWDSFTHLAILDINILGLQDKNHSGYRLGTFPASLYNVSTLEGLYLTATRLEGTLSPQGVLGWPNLRDLYLRGNLLSGPIPPTLRHLPLENLSLGTNEFEGDLPVLSDGGLRTLHLSYAFVGVRLGGQDHPFPVWVTALSQVSLLQLGSLRLTGTIPSNLTALSKLEYLTLTSNMLSGELPELKNLPLRSVQLQVNDFTYIPPLFLSNCSQLNVLQLAHNKFVGEMPDIFLDKPNLQVVYLSYNRDLVGTFPTSLSNCHEIVLFSAKVTGLSGQLPSLEAPQLISFRAGRGAIAGTIPESLLVSHGLRVLDITGPLTEYGDLSGSLPTGAPHAWPNLTLLVLSTNKLSGTLDPGLGYLTRLGTVAVSANFFTGSLPAVPPNAITLLYDDNFFEGIAPDGLCDIVTFNLRGNSKLNCPLPSCCSTAVTCARQCCDASCVPLRMIVWDRVLLVGIIMAGVLVVVIALALHWLWVWLAGEAVRWLSGAVRALHVWWAADPLPNERDPLSPDLDASRVEAKSRSWRAWVLQQPDRVPIDAIRFHSSSPEDGVWTATWDGRNVNAVEFDCTSSRQLDAMLREIRFLKLMRHPNILQLLAVTVIPDRDVVFVLTDVFRASMAAYLRDPILQTELRELTLREQLTLALGAVRATQYLHSFSPCTLHRCLTPESFLLDSAARLIVLSNFREACTEEDSETCPVKDPPPERFLAPELFTGGRNSTSSDIFCLGVTLSELLAGTELFQGSRYSEYLPTARFILESMMAPEPGDRPNVGNVLDLFRQLNTQVRAASDSSSSGSASRTSRSSSYSINPHRTAQVPENVYGDMPSLHSIQADLSSGQGLIIFKPTSD